MRYSPRHWKSFSSNLLCFDLKQTCLASFRRVVHRKHRTCQLVKELHSHFPSLQAIFKSTSIVYGQKSRSRAGELRFDISKANICPWRQDCKLSCKVNLELLCYILYILFNKAVLHFVTEMSLSYIRRCQCRQKCEIPRNRWQEFQSNERLVWPFHTLCRTIIKVSSISVSEMPCCL